jgi:hypothetical protein
MLSLGVLVGQPAACDLGHWLGRRDGPIQSPTELARTRSWQRAVLGFAGLLIGFTCAMVTSRLDRAEGVHGRVLLLLVMSSSVAMASLGYTCGLAGTRLRLGLLVIPLVVGAVIVSAL